MCCISGHRAVVSYAFWYLEIRIWIKWPNTDEGVPPLWCYHFPPPHNFLKTLTGLQAAQCWTVSGSKTTYLIFSGSVQPQAMLWIEACEWGSLSHILAFPGLPYRSCVGCFPQTAKCNEQSVSIRITFSNVSFIQTHGHVASQRLTCRVMGHVCSAKSRSYSHLTTVCNTTQSK